MTEQRNEENLTMADFEDEIAKSFHRIQYGDLLNATVIGITDSSVLVDLGSFTEGIIPADELSYDPHFSLHTDITVGEQFKVYVLKEDDGEGNIVASKKRADELSCWESFQEAMENKTIFSVKLSSSVTGGMITYLNGMRAFIPASQLSLSYVENLEEWVNKKVDAVIITVDEEKKRLVLSAKEVAKERANEEHAKKISAVQKGIVTTGTVEKIAPYGAFVNIGDGLTGLVHISQICGRHLKSPNEVLKLGQEVKVKVLDVVDSKISLSIKAVEEMEQVVEDVEETETEYISEGSASTSLGSLFKNIKL